jgi:hypothetical protein
MAGVDRGAQARAPVEGVSGAELVREARDERERQLEERERRRDDRR